MPAGVSDVNPSATRGLNTFENATMVAITITGQIIARENDPAQNYPHYANIGPGGYYQH